MKFDSMTWELFRHYLLSRRAGALVRTVAWLCIAGVGMGVASLVIVLSVMNGFNETMERRLLAVEPHLLIQVPKIRESNDLKSHPAAVALAANKNVQQMELVEKQDVILRTVDGLFAGAIARGVEKESLGYVLRHVFQATTPGHPFGSSEIESPEPTAESSDLGPGEILMGIDLARGLGVFEGDKIVIVAPEALLLPIGQAPPFERVVVKGLLTTNIPDIDGKVLYYNRAKTFAHLRKAVSREVGIEVRLNDPHRFAGLKRELESLGAVVSSWIERNSALFYALRMEKLAIGTFLALSALIASFSIITVIVLLMTQKRKDIGVLMSMGLSAQKTRILFVRLGLYLASIGIGGGLFIGVVVCLFLDRVQIPLLPDIYYDSTLPAKVDPLFVLIIALVSSLIALVSAYLPARSHANLLPAEALRSQRHIHAKPS